MRWTLRIGLCAAAAVGCASSAPEPKTADEEMVTVDVDAKSTSEDGEAEAKAAEIEAALAKLETETVGALSSSVAMEGVLSDADIPPGLLEAAASQTDLAHHLASGSGAGSLSAIGGGSTGATTLAASGGGADQPAKPRGSVTIAAPTVEGGTVSNAAAVVARMRGRMRRCYVAGLYAEPDLKGVIALRIGVGLQGEVQSVDAQTTKLTKISACIKAVAQSGGFAPPEGSPAVVSVSASFEPER